MMMMMILFAFLEAALACGWQPTPTTPPHAAATASGPSGTLYRSDYYLILDLPSQFANYDDLGGDGLNNVQIVEPLFANPKDDDKVLPSEIRRVLTQPGKKVFLTLGSSGGQEFVVRAVQAICEGKWNAVVALAPSRCTIQDVCRSIKHIPDCVVLTQEFVHAKLIASMVDVVVALMEGRGHFRMLWPLELPLSVSPCSGNKNLTLTKSSRRVQLFVSPRIHGLFPRFVNQ
jgi:hypothetical protein